MPKFPLIVKLAIPVVGLVVTICLAVAVIGLLKAWWTVPLEPFKVTGTQPIEFRHDVHVEAEIDCEFCHRTAISTETAGLPAVQQCYFCHQKINPDHPEISKIISSLENNTPINWIRVHRLPDHVQFVHDAHVQFFSQQNEVPPSQVCSICHGDVGSMGIAKQVRNLKMRDCVDCHRGGYLTYLNEDAEEAIRNAIETGQRSAPPTDCAACHY